MSDVPILINCLGECLCETLVSIHREHPEWLYPKFRNYPWHDKSFRLKFYLKFNQKFAYVVEPDQLIDKLINLLSEFFLPSFFVSYQFVDLLSNIRKYTHPALELEAQQRQKYTVSNNFIERFKVLDEPLAILLVDAENISLDISLENIIYSICNYPIKIKIAFANWRSLGKKDLDFYHKGYEMIHVPQGKNSADLKMITVGSSIWGHYPMAREFVICSSDCDLNHLCIALQNKGLTVYRVSRKAEQIMVFNSQTGKTTNYNLNVLPESFSLEDLVTKIKEIIIEQQTKHKTCWVQLKQVAELFKNKHHVEIEAILAYHFPEKNILEALLELKKDLVLHKVTENSEIYVTIFDVKKYQELPLLNNGKAPINSVQDLETYLLKTVKSLTTDVNQDYVMITHVASEFQKDYTISLTKGLKNLQVPGNFVKFLEISDKFSLKKENNLYYVGLA